MGTGEARQADGTSSLCTAQLILLRIKDSRKEKSDGRSPLSLSLSLSLALLSPFFRVWRRGKKTSNKKRDSFANVQQPIRVPHGALGEEEQRERG